MAGCKHTTQINSSQNEPGSITGICCISCADLRASPLCVPNYHLPVKAIFKSKINRTKPNHEGLTNLHSAVVIRGCFRKDRSHWRTPGSLLQSCAKPMNETLLPANCRSDQKTVQAKST